MEGDVVTGSRGRFSTQVSVAVQARARATVRGLARTTNNDYTLAQLTEDALDAYCKEMETLYNEGKPWSPAERPLRPGARVR